MSIKTIFAAAIVAAFAASPILAEGEAQDIKSADKVGGKRLGQLNCKVDGGWGLLLGSSKKATCEFRKADGTSETYTGKLNKLGVDIGVTEEAYMTWVVFTRADAETGPAALLGKYSGVSAEATLGIGLGANALIGGDNKSIGLQPVIVPGNTGLNIAVGLASLTLDAAS